MMVANKKKILWAVIVLLMLFELFTMVLGYRVSPWTFPLYAFTMTHFYVLLLRPVVTCILIVITKQCKLLWIATVPSIVQYIVYAIFANFFRSYILSEFAGYLSLFYLISTCICVALAYLCVWIVTNIKNKRNS
jgi:hypothetical protein